MTNKYRQSAATNPMQVEEKETPKVIHDFGTYVLSPAGRGYVFGGSIGAGIALSIGALAETSIPLFVVGMTFAFAGVFGLLILREQIAEFNRPVSNWSRRETPMMQDVLPAPDERTAKMNGERRYLQRAPKVLAYADDSYQFSGKQLDKLEMWYLEGHTTIRRDTSKEGPGWSEIGIKSNTYGRVIYMMEKKGYIGKPEGGNVHQWTVKGVREFLEIDE